MAWPRAEQVQGRFLVLLGCHPSGALVGFPIEAPLRGEEVKLDDIALLGVSPGVLFARCCVATAADCDCKGWMVGVAGSELLGEAVRTGAIRGFVGSAYTPADGPACSCKFPELDG